MIRWLRWRWIRQLARWRMAGKREDRALWAYYQSSAAAQSMNKETK